MGKTQAIHALCVGTHRGVLCHALGIAAAPQWNRCTPVTLDFNRIAVDPDRPRGTRTSRSESRSSASASAVAFFVVRRYAVDARELDLPYSAWFDAADRGIDRITLGAGWGHPIGLIRGCRIRLDHNLAVLRLRRRGLLVL